MKGENALIARLLQAPEASSQRKPGSIGDVRCGSFKGPSYAIMDSSLRWNDRCKVVSLKNVIPAQAGIPCL